MAKAVGKQVSTTISPELYEAFQEARWEQKIDKFTDVIREALEMYARDYLDFAPSDEDTPKS